MHVPGWHEATAKLQAQGRLRMVGLIQEQHPDRCRLFMQWKRMDWPVMVDSLDLLGVSVVPITLAIDEHGVIRHRLRRPNLEWLEENFLRKTYAPPSAATAAPARRPDLKRLGSAAKLARREETPNALAALEAYGDALVTWARAKRLTTAIKSYKRCVSIAPDSAVVHFRLGVAYRKRFDSRHRRPNDFQHAVDHWAKALDIDPNNYIWRRRIQQYGPRMMKPYPFYDWVPTARKEIRTRGEEPLPLTVEPGGAEFARPARRFEGARSGPSEPDAKNRITRDRGLIRAEATIVPPVVHPGGAARVHLVFTPNADHKAHWNNESGPSTVWVVPPDGWEVDKRLLTLPQGGGAVSREARTVEFEVRCPANARAGQTRLKAYALYYVCAGAGGQCLYRRQDLSTALDVRR
ncbi:MAG: hypothetical protein ACE5E1_10150 [Phycisphaerae bacterium]